MRAEKAYDAFNGQIGQVYEQIMDIEQRLIRSFKKDTDKQVGIDTKLQVFEKYLTVIQPMNTFHMVTEALHNCFSGTSSAGPLLNSCIEYETAVMWPALQLRLNRFGVGGSEVKQLDLTAFTEVPAPPAKVDIALSE